MSKLISNSSVWISTVIIRDWGREALFLGKKDTFFCIKQMKDCKNAKISLRLGLDHDNCRV